MCVYLEIEVCMCGGGLMCLYVCVEIDVFAFVCGGRLMCVCVCGEIDVFYVCVWRETEVSVCMCRH